MPNRRIHLSPRLRPWRHGLERLFDAEATTGGRVAKLAAEDKIICRDDHDEINWAKKLRRHHDLPITVIGPGPIQSVRPEHEHVPFSIWYCDLSADAQIDGDFHRTSIKNALSNCDETRGEHALNAWNTHNLSAFNTHLQHRLKHLPKDAPDDAERHVVVVDHYLLQNAPGLIDRIRADAPTADVSLAIVNERVSWSGLGAWPDTDETAELGDPISDAELIARSDKLYVHAHSIGFGAIMAGKSVYCTGTPFYAGWGFSEDAQPSDETRDISLSAFADAALVGSVLYRDPYEGHRIDFEEAFEIYGFLHDRFRENKRRAYCIGVKWWNHESVGALLDGAGGPAVFDDDFKSALRGAKNNHGRIVAWSSAATDERAAECARAGIPFLRVEDGFLRSVGLGAALAKGASAAFDTTGIYFDATRPSDLETMIENVDLDDDQLRRAADLRDAIIKARLTKYNVGRRRTDLEIPSDRATILVPGQVADDAGILKTLSQTVDCSGKTNVNESLLKAVRARSPDAYVIYKPHPDVEADLRKGRVYDDIARQYADAIVTDVDILDLIERCDRIETVSSLTGFEALMRGKSVTAHGMPFYAGWGLTEDLTTCPRRTRRRTIDELVYFALIAYGRYIDPETLLPCRPERLVDNLRRLRGDKVHGAKYSMIKFASWFGRKIGL